MANLRFRVLPRFPARLFATGGLGITKAGADWTVAPDWGTLAVLSSITDSANSEVWVRVTSAGVSSYFRMTLQALVSSLAQTGAGYSFVFTFDTTTTDADPGPGKFRLNQAVENTATIAYVDLTDAGGVDITAILDSLTPGQFSLTKVGDSTKRLLGTLATVTTATGYRKLAIAITGSSAASPFSNGDSVLFQYVKSGVGIITGATDNALLRADGTGGATSQGSVVVVDDSGGVAWPANFALSGDISPAQITSNQNDYNPTGLATASTLRINSDAARDITGLQGGADGRLIVIHNIGAFAITLKDESGSSTAANRFALTADIALVPDDIAGLQYDSTTSRWRLLASPGRPATVQYFIASGTYTKPAGLRAAVVEITGSGGGGGGAAATSGTEGACGGGGGAGEYARKRILASAIGATETVTCGAAGTAGANTGGNGGAGNTSSFGAHVSAGGGAGGTGGSNGTTATVESGGAGGTGGTGSDFQVVGGGGENSTKLGGSAGQCIGGRGGSGLWGGAGSSTRGAGTAPAGGAGSRGGGGGGGSSQNAAGALGGAGGVGVVIVWEFF